MAWLTNSEDSKQARDLVQILTESKQQVDPRLIEMSRYGGGGGGGRWGGGRGGRGGGRGGGKFDWSTSCNLDCWCAPSGYSGSNSAPVGNRRW